MSSLVIDWTRFVYRPTYQPTNAKQYTPTSLKGGITSTIREWRSYMPVEVYDIKEAVVLGRDIMPAGAPGKCPMCGNCALKRWLFLRSLSLSGRGGRFGVIYKYSNQNQQEKKLNNYSSQNLIKLMCSFGIYILRGDSEKGLNVYK